MSWDPEMVAAHELGHAIVARECGLTPGNIKMEISWWSGEATSGYCELKSFMYPVPGDNPEPGGWKLYRGMLIMTAAGQVASEHWFQLRGQPIQHVSGSDYEMFVQDAVVMPNPPTWDQAKEEARQIVVAHWEEIVQLTPALVENRRLSGGKVA
jgi:hypothetical protein